MIYTVSQAAVLDGEQIKILFRKLLIMPQN